MPGKISREIGLYLCALVIAQPVLDMLSYFLRFFSIEIIITLLRGGLLGLGILLGLRHRVFKTFDYVYAVLLVMFGAASFYVKQRAMPQMNQMLEITTFAKLFFLPAMFLVILRLVSADRKALPPLVVRAVYISAWVVVISVVLSYVTNTYNHTYDQPWAKIGVAGWFYSGNQQSLVLIALMPVLMIVSLRRKNIVIGLAAIAAAAGLLLFNGTRVAWVGWLTMGALVLFLMLLPMRGRGFAWRDIVLMLVILAGLVAAVVFRGQLPIGSVNNQRQSQLPGLDKTVEIYDEADSGGAPAQFREDEYIIDVAGRYQLLIVPPLDEIRWESLTGTEALAFERNLSRPDRTAFEFATALEFSQKIGESTARQRFDHRYRQRLFANTARQHADIPIRLFGMPHQFYSEYIGDFETDYSFMYASYGLLGSMLFALVFVVETLRKARGVRCLSFKQLRSPHFVVPAYVFLMFMGAAFFAGRTFQQPAVSVYLAFSFAYLLTYYETLGGTGEKQI